MKAAADFGSRLKLVSSAWFTLFFYLWLEGKLGAGLLIVALLTAVYWTIGSSMENFEWAAAGHPGG